VREEKKRRGGGREKRRREKKKANTIKYGLIEYYTATSHTIVA
jgi:hypothetical protein